MTNIKTLKENFQRFLLKETFEDGKPDGPDVHSLNKASDKDPLEEMVLAILSEADYDLYKSYLPETAEEPEFVEERLEQLVSIARSFVNVPDQLNQDEDEYEEEPLSGTGNEAPLGAYQAAGEKQRP